MRCSQPGAPRRPGTRSPGPRRLTPTARPTQPTGWTSSMASNSKIWTTNTKTARRSRAARGGQHDVRAAPVTGTVLPGDEPAPAHARQHVREPALLPVQGQAELERAELALGRLAELHEHLVLGQREPAIGLKQPVQPGGQQRSGAQVSTPGSLFVRSQPPVGHSPMLPGINDVSYMLTGA